MDIKIIALSLLLITPFYAIESSIIKNRLDSFSDRLMDICPEGIYPEYALENPRLFSCYNFTGKFIRAVKDASGYVVGYIHLVQNRRFFSATKLYYGDIVIVDDERYSYRNKNKSLRHIGVLVRLNIT